MLGTWQVLKAENWKPHQVQVFLKQCCISVNRSATYSHAHTQITVVTRVVLHIFQHPISNHTASSISAISLLQREVLQADSLDVWLLAIQHVRILPPYMCSRTTDPELSHPWSLLVYTSVTHYISLIFFHISTPVALLRTSRILMQMKTRDLTFGGIVIFFNLLFKQFLFIPHTHSQDPHIKNYWPDLLSKKKP